MMTTKTHPQSTKRVAERLPQIITRPGGEYGPAARTWQGIPAIECAKNGRLWAAWYTGQWGEGPGNYVVLGTSDDDGKTWTDPATVVAPASTVEREFDPCLWHDPSGRLWFFWAQVTQEKWAELPQETMEFDGRAGVWEMHTSNSDAANPTWSAPRRIGNGIMINKPTVVSNGRWLLPTAVWARIGREFHPELDAERFSNVLASDDHGQTFRIIGCADVPDRTYDEHMLIELRDGRLWMPVRTSYGVGESFSSDGGQTWSPGKPSAIQGPGSRFHLRRLRSGRLLLVNHDRSRTTTAGLMGRSHLTAWLSDDDGQTWRGGLLLDERQVVSYPDGVETVEGNIHVIYDFDRGDGNSPTAGRQIFMAVFGEQDVEAGRLVSADARLRVPVSQATGLKRSCYVPAPNQP